MELHSTEDEFIPYREKPTPLPDWMLRWIAFLTFQAIILKEKMREKQFWIILGAHLGLAYFYTWNVPGSYLLHFFIYMGCLIFQD